MQKNAIRSLFAMVVLILTGLYVYAQDDLVSVDDSAFLKPMRPPVAFLHDQHNENAEIDDCATCHHLYDEAGNLVEDETSEDMECSECHGTESSGYPMTLVRAFHLNCRGCHVEQKAGPVVCGECHKHN